MNLIPNDTDRGQVGIGTLIVFIAMVLVAAIAAGVLINTAGFLQTQAEDTGTESTEQVANNINVITQVGVVDDDGDNITELRVGVQPAAGADAINLEDLTIQYVSSSDFANLIHNDSDNEGVDDVFTTEAVSAQDSGDNVMSQSGDRYEVVIDLDSDETDLSDIQPGEEVQLTITTPQGSQVGATLRAPDSSAALSPGDTVEM